jgi:threonine/homoserine/homoserine lactone efflux protein
VPDASTLLLFALASLALLAIPGPAVIYVVTRSVDQGRSAGLISVLGVESGTFAYALAAGAGLTGLVAASETGFTIVKFAGAAYLIYLGTRKLLGRDAAAAAAQPSARSRLYLQGLGVQLLNPKIAVFFLAFLPQFANADRGPIAPQVLLLGTVFTLLAVLSDGTYALLAGALGRRLVADKAIARLSGGIYIGLGISAALTGNAHSATTG